MLVTAVTLGVLLITGGIVVARKSTPAQIVKPGAVSVATPVSKYGRAPLGANTPTLTPCAGGTSFLNRSITASDTPLPNRVSQNGVASVCGVNKTFTGSIPTTNHH